MAGLPPPAAITVTDDRGATRPAAPVAHAAHLLSEVLLHVRPILLDEGARNGGGKFSTNALIGAIEAATGRSRADARRVAESLIANEAVRARGITDDSDGLVESDVPTHVFYAGVKSGIRIPQAVLVAAAPCYSPTCTGGGTGCYSPACPRAIPKVRAGRPRPACGGHAADAHAH